MAPVIHKKVKNGNVTECMRSISRSMITTSVDGNVTCKQCKAALKAEAAKDAERRASYSAIRRARAWR